MGMSLRGQKRIEETAFTHNQLFKKRWSSWLLRSTVLAAVAHAVLFIIWPVWNITYVPEERELEAMQLRPIASVGTLSDPVDSPTTSLRSPEESEFDLARSGVGEEDELLNLLELYATPLPNVVRPVTSTTEQEEEPPSQIAMLDLELAAIIPRPARLPGTINYPLIRNPVAVVRYLRDKYNPVYRDSGATGSVTVMMWVNERGAVDWTEVSESSGHPVLDEIAVALFNEVAVFRAARSEGTRIPVAVVMSVPLSLPW